MAVPIEASPRQFSVPAQETSEAQISGYEWEIHPEIAGLPALVLRVGPSSADSRLDLDEAASRVHVVTKQPADGRDAVEYVGGYALNYFSPDGAQIYSVPIYARRATTVGVRARRGYYTFWQGGSNDADLLTANLIHYKKPDPQIDGYHASYKPFGLTHCRLFHNPGFYPDIEQGLSDYINNSWKDIPVGERRECTLSAAYTGPITLTMLLEDDGTIHTATGYHIRYPQTVIAIASQDFPDGSLDVSPRVGPHHDLNQYDYVVGLRPSLPLFLKGS